MRKRLLRAALLTSTLGLVVVAAIELSLPSLASTTRRSMAPRVESAEGAVTPSQGIADSDTLVDLNLAPAPTPSRVVLAERLHVLGATPEAALGAVSLIDAGAPATGAIAALGLETSHSAKAESLVAAYLGHRPVAFEGFDMGPEVEGFVAQSIAAGVDPDEAGWMALT